MPKEHYSELQKAVEIPADIVKYNEATDLIGGGAFGEVFSGLTFSLLLHRTFRLVF